MESGSGFDPIHIIGILRLRSTQRSLQLTRMLILVFDNLLFIKFRTKITTYQTVVLVTKNFPNNFRFIIKITFKFDTKQLPGDLMQSR